jgi:hypothetical protein
MPFFHTYKCVRCRRDFVETDNLPNSPQTTPRRTHADVAPMLPLGSEERTAASRCISLLQYVKTEFQGPPPPQPVALHVLALNYWQTLAPKPGMACAARQRVAPYATGYGRSAHGIPRGLLAGGLGAQLPIPAAVNEWTSDNCAEVHAAHQILHALNANFGATGGIDFHCIDATGHQRPACVNCATWIHRI